MRRRIPLADVLPEDRMIDPRLLRLPELENFNGLTEEITRQIRDSLFFLSFLQTKEGMPAFEAAHISCFLEMTRWYIDCTLDPHGRLLTRRVERNRDGSPEPVANHPLRTLDIGLGLYDRLQLTSEVSNQAWFQQIEQQLFELVFTLLLHDSFEDATKFQDRTVEARLREKLGANITKHLPGFSDDRKQALIEQVVLKIRALSIMPEEKANGGMVQYLERVWHDPVCRLVKGADIVQNALSPHNESQRQKYRAHYVPYLLRLLSFEGFRSHDWLNPNIINRMLTANPYLEEVFAQAGEGGWRFTQFAGKPMIKNPN